jgi:large subunit ribosomal protein L27
MATKKAGGSSRNGRDSCGKRLGVKIFGGSFASKGSIILRQRGLQWRPGLHVKKGSDFTLYAICEGIVQYNYNCKTRKSSVQIIKQDTL